LIAVRFFQELVLLPGSKPIVLSTPPSANDFGANSYNIHPYLLRTKSSAMHNSSGYPAFPTKFLANFILPWIAAMGIDRFGVAAILSSITSRYRNSAWKVWRSLRP
jgi:hypothetical protein